MRPVWTAGVRYSTVGLELVLSFGFFAGRWLDGKFDTAPILQLVGFIFGTIAGFRALYRASKFMKRETETDGWDESMVDRDARFELAENETPVEPFAEEPDREHRADPP